MLRCRATLLQNVRRFFDSRGFLEVDTPVLSSDVVVDRYLEPIPVHVAEIGLNDFERPMMWLQTSPEFAMKRLLASGATAIYQIAHAFRAGEVGCLHNPEFSMLEWYRVGDDMIEGMNLLAEFAEQLLGTEPCDRISYRDAFIQFARIDVFSSEAKVLLEQFADSGELDSSTMKNADGGCEPDIDIWRNLLLTHLVEPNLGVDRPVIVYDWPASQAALSVIRNGDPPVAERFELYYRGVELANGYHELLDADELLQRNRKINGLRAQDGKRILPEESRLVEAMQAGLPACSGVALGIDRLLMIAMGCQSIRDVMPFPIGNA